MPRQMPEPNIFYGPFPTQENYTTGTGQELVNIHKADLNCRRFGCVIHHPSNHRMQDWPTNYRSDRELMERMCPHNIGHPDPDQINYIRRVAGPEQAWGAGVHGCDGCCRGEGPSVEIDMRP